MAVLASASCRPTSEIIGRDEGREQVPTAEADHEAGGEVGQVATAPAAQAADGLFGGRGRVGARVPGDHSKAAGPEA